jgi:hypothetical protein
MPLPLLAAIPALLGGLGGAGGILGALGGAGGIMGMISKILPFGDMLGGIMKNLFSPAAEDSAQKQDQAQEGGAQAKQDAGDFLSRMAENAVSIIKPFSPILNLLG